MSNRPTDNHHILPKSRCKELGIDPNFTGNVIRVKTGKHRAWHQLFGNKTAEEAIEVIQAEWSLSKEGVAEFNRLTNVRFLHRRRK